MNETIKNWAEVVKSFENPDGTFDVERFVKSDEFKKAVLKWKKDYETLSAEKIEGFVALFDILGFQSILRNDDIASVMLSYQQMESLRMHELVNEVLNQEIVKTRNYSDTFLIYTTEVSDRSFRLLLLVSNFLFMSAYGHKMPIRGATAVGELYVSDSVAIGKPIIEAYENERKQDWIGCWITQECINRISKETLEELKDKKTIVEYPIPLKDGHVRVLYALNWPSLFRSTMEKEFLKTTGYLTSKDNHGWAEERKHKNTREFIDYIYSVSGTSLKEKGDDSI